MRAALLLALVALVACTNEWGSDPPEPLYCRFPEYPAKSECDLACATIQPTAQTGECRITRGGIDLGCPRFIESAGYRGCCVESVGHLGVHYFGFFECE